MVSRRKDFCLLAIVIFLIATGVPNQSEASLQWFEYNHQTLSERLPFQSGFLVYGFHVEDHEGEDLDKDRMVDLSLGEFDGFLGDDRRNFLYGELGRVTFVRTGDGNIHITEARVDLTWLRRHDTESKSNFGCGIRFAAFSAPDDEHRGKDRTPDVYPFVYPNDDDIAEDRKGGLVAAACGATGNGWVAIGGVGFFSDAVATREGIDRVAALAAHGIIAIPVRAVGQITIKYLVAKGDNDYLQRRIDIEQEFDFFILQRRFYARVAGGYENTQWLYGIDKITGLPMPERRREKYIQAGIGFRFGGRSLTQKRKSKSKNKPKTKP